MQDNHLSDIQEGHEEGHEAAGKMVPHVSPNASSSAFYDSSDVYHSGDHYTARISDYSISDKPNKGSEQHGHGLQDTAKQYTHANICRKLNTICRQVENALSERVLPRMHADYGRWASMRSAPGRLERERFQLPSDTDTPFDTEKSSNLSIFRSWSLSSQDSC
jgi:hypothetical protein